MKKPKWQDSPYYPKRELISKEEIEQRKIFLANLIGKEALENLDDQQNALEIEMMMKLGKTEDEISNRIIEMGYEQKSGRQEIHPLNDSMEVAPNVTTPSTDSYEEPRKPNDLSGGINPKGELKFSDFDIQNPEIPSNEEEFVSLVDEENSVVNIGNLTLAECREIVDILDSTITEAVKTKTNQSLKFRGKTRSINFSIIYIPKEDKEIISVTGRYVEDESDEGSYCHDFEVDGVTIEDWNKLKSLIQK